MDAPKETRQVEVVTRAMKSAVSSMKKYEENLAKLAACLEDPNAHSAKSKKRMRVFNAKCKFRLTPFSQINNLLFGFYLTCIFVVPRRSRYVSFVQNQAAGSRRVR